MRAQGQHFAVDEQLAEGGRVDGLSDFEMPRGGPCNQRKEWRKVIEQIRRRHQRQHGSNDQGTFADFWPPTNPCGVDENDHSRKQIFDNSPVHAVAEPLDGFVIRIVPVQPAQTHAQQRSDGNERTRQKHQSANRRLCVRVTMSSSSIEPDSHDGRSGDHIHGD